MIITITVPPEKCSNQIRSVSSLHIFCDKIVIMDSTIRQNNNSYPMMISWGWRCLFFCYESIKINYHKLGAPFFSEYHQWKELLSVCPTSSENSRSTRKEACRTEWMERERERSRNSIKKIWLMNLPMILSIIYFSLSPSGSIFAPHQKVVSYPFITLIPHNTTLHKNNFKTWTLKHTSTYLDDVS